MAKTDFRSVDEYLAAQPEAARATLDKVRSIIRDILPDAEEVISYQIPAYKQHGGAVVYFSGWKEHYSLHRARSISSPPSRRRSHLTSPARARCAFRSPSQSR